MQRFTNGLNGPTEAELLAQETTWSGPGAHGHLGSRAALDQQVPGLSAFLVSHNDAATIGDAIARLRNLASEIVLIDQGSIDGTVEIARQLGARVLSQSNRSRADLKRFGESQCTGPWLLHLEASEMVSEALEREICTLFKQGGPGFDAYRVKFANAVPPGREVANSPRQENAVRLYRKDAGHFSPSTIADRVELKKGVRTGLLKERIFERASEPTAIRQAPFATGARLGDVPFASRPSSLRRTLVRAAVRLMASLASHNR